MSFYDLDRAELYRTAIEDFAVEVHHAAGVEKIIKALDENGVTWDLYVQANPSVAGVVTDVAAIPEETVVYETTSTTGPEGVVTSDLVTGVRNEPVVRTQAQQVKVGTADQYLVKMNRENPLFEFRGHRFTQEKPFAIMSARDADAILRDEEGFGIATPSDALEYYN